MTGIENSFGFNAFVNVDIQVVETETNTIKRHVKKHNKATRNMIEGFLRFLEGRFTSTYANDKPEYTDDAKNYIPCYISFGDGGVSYDSDGYPVLDPNAQETAHVPALSDWNTVVDYNSTSMVKELSTLSNNRSPIRKQDNTIDLGTPPAGDMDTTVFYCEVGPAELNQDISNNPRIITEVGLFSSSYKKDNDLLAYVKLGNYTGENDELKTNTLYVRPGDTVIINWYITIVAMSDVSVVDASEELLESEIGSIVIGE